MLSEEGADETDDQNLGARYPEGVSASGTLGAHNVWLRGQVLAPRETAADPTLTLASITLL